MILVCDNTDMAEHFHKMISGEALVEETDADPDATPTKGKRRKRKLSKRFSDGLTGFPDLWNRQGFEATLRIDSKPLAAAESEDPIASSKEAAEKLRKVVSTIGVAGQPGERIRCVVSEPDFIVELKAGLKVVVEVKGRTHAETSIKHEAAKGCATF